MPEPLYICVYRRDYVLGEYLGIIRRTWQQTLAHVRFARSHGQTICRVERVDA